MTVTGVVIIGFIIGQWELRRLKEFRSEIRIARDLYSS